MVNKNEKADSALNAFAARMKQAEELKKQEQGMAENVENPSTSEKGASRENQKGDAESKIGKDSDASAQSESKQASLGNKTRRAKRVGYTQYGITIRDENVEYLNKLKDFEGITLIDVINNILDEHREKREKALDEAIEELNKKRAALRDK